jgi:hypothetical protein
MPFVPHHERKVLRNPWVVTALSVTASATRQHWTRDIGLSPIGLGNVVAGPDLEKFIEKLDCWARLRDNVDLLIFILTAGTVHSLASKSISPH